MVKNKKKARRGGTTSAERFQTLIRLSSDFYWETDPEHRLTELAHASGRSIALPALWHAHIAAMDERLPFRGSSSPARPAARCTTTA